MTDARAHDDGRVQWVEVCYCSTPARRRARVLGRILRSRESAGRPRPQPLPDLNGTEALVLRRLRLLGSPRSPPRRPRAVRSSTCSATRNVMPSSSLQALLARASAALERGRGAEAGAAADARAALVDAARETTSSPSARCSPKRGCCRTISIRPRPRSADRPTRSATPSRRAGSPTLWRLHGRLASARGDQSRAIALHGRALKQAEAAHDSRAIGLAHYELGQCYRHVGDTAIVREHITKAASALHAAGDRRHLALVHSLSSILLAQVGEYDEAMGALRQAERLAVDGARRRRPGDGVRQPGRRDDDGAPLRAGARAGRAQRGAARSARIGTRTRGRARPRSARSACASAISTRAEDALHRALERPQPDSVSRDDGRRLRHARADPHDSRRRTRRRPSSSPAPARRTARTDGRPASGTNGRSACSARGWRCGAARSTRPWSLADEILQAGAPPFDALQATLIAAEALTRAGRLPEAEQRLAAAADALDPKVAPAAWGEYLRLRGGLHAKSGSAADAYHDFAQSATLLDLLGERYQAALSHLALGRLVAQTGARSVAERHLESGARRLRAARRPARFTDAHATPAASSPSSASGEYVISPADADDAIVRRIVDAAALPDLLGRETAAGDARSRRRRLRGRLRQPPGRRRARGRGRRVRRGRGARRWRGPRRTATATAAASMIVEPLGRDPEGPRFGLVASPRPLGHPGDAAPAHDRHRRASGICAVRGARSADRARPSRRSIDRSSRSCRASSRPAPR